MLIILYPQFGSPMVNSRLLMTWQPHSPGDNHHVYCHNSDSNVARCFYNEVSSWCDIFNCIHLISQRKRKKITQRKDLKYWKESWYWNREKIDTVPILFCMNFVKVKNFIINISSTINVSFNAPYFFKEIPLFFKEIPYFLRKLLLNT